MHQQRDYTIPCHSRTLLRMTGDRREHIATPGLAKCFRNKSPMITKVSGFGILSTALLGALETHNPAAEMCV